jgi:hypothetical protein
VDGALSNPVNDLKPALPVVCVVVMSPTYDGAPSRQYAYGRMLTRRAFGVRVRRPEPSRPMQMRHAHGVAWQTGA